MTPRNLAIGSGPSIPMGMGGSSLLFNLSHRDIPQGAGLSGRRNDFDEAALKHPQKYVGVVKPAQLVQAGASPAKSRNDLNGTL
jgi:hypothetical protein